MTDAAKAAASAPDPDEDDLDDLDDVLDQFQAKPPIPPPQQQPTPAPPPNASGPGRPPPEDGDELSKELQAGMSGLISELGSNPAMQQEFEEMMKELVAAGTAPSAEEAARHVQQASEVMPKDESSTAAKKESDNFQETIRRTMERMQQSGDAATAATASGSGGGDEDEILAQMMKELGAGGEGSEEDFNKMLMGMMSQLTHREILLEPMKELHDKFPEWMAKNRAATSRDDLQRYEEQQKLVGEIVRRFERPGYSDDNDEDRAYIVDRMQKMQAAGSPPPDLVGDMSAAQEALGDLESGCPTQ